jgi:hypothetical protein
LAGWLAFTTEYLEVKGGIFLKKLKTQQGEQLVIIAVQDSQDVCLTQRTACTFKHVKQSAGTFLKKRKRENDEPLASSTVQDSHDILKVGLAQINPIIFQSIKDNAGTFLKERKTETGEAPTVSTMQDSHDVTHSYHPHTVVFDSPGCKDILSQMTDKLDVRLHGRLINLQHLDITSYLSAPNIINTCNSHLGTAYRIFIDLSDMGWIEENTPFYNLATHSMDKIKQAFQPETGQVRNDDNGKLKIQEVADWPVIAGLMYGAELNDFFEMGKGC